MTHTYQIQLSTQLGTRRGVLCWTEQAGVLDGTLDLLGQRTSLTGHKNAADVCCFSGTIRTLVSCIPYRAVCSLHGSRLQGTFHTASGDYSVAGECAAG